MNRIQSKYHRIGAYEIKKMYFSCFDYKIYIQNNEYECESKHSRKIMKN